MTFNFAPSVGKRVLFGALTIGCVSLFTGLVACGGADGARADGAPRTSEIAHVHKARCGSCHVRVEPGERSRAQLEAAFSRHRGRVHMTEEQWGEMVNYLAAPEQADRVGGAGGAGDMLSNARNAQ